MSASAVHQIPVVPPRPSKSPVKDTSTNMPAIPPRPAHRRIERSRSPNPERFAQSPLNGGITPRTSNISLLSPLGNNGESDDFIDRSNGLPMPSVGEEGVEYTAVARQLNKGQETSSEDESPEQTRTVGDDLKLHAPKPSFSAENAKQRVMNVTRTDSDKAAAFGIGKPGYPEERAASREGLRKKPSTNFSTTSEREQAYLTDDEHGIPEIGQRVPMNPHLGDVQAPSPALGSDGHSRNHSRKLSARGLPPGSYGMHGHGVASQDELDKAYYKKHPELARDQHTPLHDHRQNNFAMSSNDLNKLVRDTASRAADRVSTTGHQGTPADEVAFQATEEYARASSTEKASQDASAQESGKPIHVNDPKHPECYSYGAELESPIDHDGDEYHAPILASDEVEKGPKGQVQHPVVRPRLERNDSSYSQDSRPTSRPTSRPSSRPASIYNALPIFDHTPLEDVEEYEPLFPEESAKNEQEKPAERKARHYFPSKDVWEDAPHSAYETAEVSTPDVTEEEPPKRSSVHWEGRPMTPAQIFALHQEELAEKEANGKKHSFLPLVADEPKQEASKTAKSDASRRFPSRDVWEDAPESSLYEAEVSESKDDGKPEVPTRPAKKTGELLRPAVPERPRSRAGVKENAAKSPASPETVQMPPIPPRPARKSSGDSKEDEARPKSAASSRPVGGRIAALQAGFMSDLNKRLQLGPTAAKKEEPSQQDAPVEQKEKAPLSDARKGRARGPQRRAPTRTIPAVAAIPEEPAKDSTTALIISVPQTIWSIDPEDGDFVFASELKQILRKEVPLSEPKLEELAITESEKAPESKDPPELEVDKDIPKSEIVKEEQQVEEPLDPEPPIVLAEVEKPKEPEASKKTETTEEPEVSEKSEVTEEPEVAKELEVVKEPEVTKEAEVAQEAEVAKESEVIEESEGSSGFGGSKGSEQSKRSEGSKGSAGSKATEGSEGFEGREQSGGIEGAEGAEDPEAPRETENAEEEEVGKESEDVKGHGATKNSDDSDWQTAVQGSEVAQKTKEPLETEEPVKEETLVANTAGESILEAKVEKKDGGNEIEPILVKDEVKDDARDDTEGGVKI
ncbi:hypothetical protein PT974_11991 [Cladobotryum mycophilum]|uniref:Altered inheritance of mitochondria protein 21 n=1 Tax=Cladobotryum mycophilum TaxID=491253 RepID=A0ABR0S7S5_9HYPO